MLTSHWNETILARCCMNGANQACSLGGAVDTKI
jgi:hypothetical protein